MKIGLFHTTQPSVFLPFLHIVDVHKRGCMVWTAACPLSGVDIARRNQVQIDDMCENLTAPSVAIDLKTTSRELPIYGTLLGSFNSQY